MSRSKGLDALRIDRAQHSSASPSVEAASGSVPEAVPPMPQGGWQPIETAPKDGTHILTFNITPVFDEDTGRTDDEPRISVAYWLWGAWMEYPAPPRFMQGQRHTHWQPLPAPPTDGDA